MCALVCVCVCVCVCMCVCVLCLVHLLALWYSSRYVLYLAIVYQQSCWALGEREREGGREGVVCVDIAILH